MCSRSSGNFCVTDLSFLWLYAVRSQTVAVMAVPTMVAGMRSAWSAFPRCSYGDAVLLRRLAEGVSGLQGTAVSTDVVGSSTSSVNRLR